MGTKKIINVVIIMYCTNCTDKSLLYQELKELSSQTLMKE